MKFSFSHSSRHVWNAHFGHQNAGTGNIKIFEILSGLKESYSLAAEGRRETHRVISVVMSYKGKGTGLQNEYHWGGREREDVLGKTSRRKKNLKGYTRMNPWDNEMVQGKVLD